MEYPTISTQESSITKKKGLKSISPSIHINFKKTFLKRYLFDSSFENIFGCLDGPPTSKPTGPECNKENFLKNP